MSNTHTEDASGVERAVHPLDDVPEPLRSAVERFVQNKYEEDAFLAATGSPLRALIRNRPHDPLWDPWEYFRDCFPFAELEFTPHANEAAFVAAVPTRQTLGYSWRWRTNNIAESERTSLIERFQTPPTNVWDAGYIWVRPLGLFAPNEGKNRVDFLRECGISTMPAWVTPRDYPAASRIKIYEVRLGGREEHWAVLDGRWVQREPALLRRALPVLEAYGVGRAQLWPYRYPSPLLVCEAFERICRSERERDPIVDLHALLHEDTDAFCSLIELENVRPRPRFWGWAFGTLILGMLATTTIPEHWPLLRELGAACCGVGLGCIGLVSSHMFRARRRMLLPPARFEARGPCDHG